VVSFTIVIFYSTDHSQWLCVTKISFNMSSVMISDNNLSVIRLIVVAPIVDLSDVVIAYTKTIILC
jgi:hypothetical protein